MPMDAREIERMIKQAIPVDVKDGLIRIKVNKNETFREEQLAEQATWENPYATLWYHTIPVISEPPYFYVGFPWVHNGIMSIESGVVLAFLTNRFLLLEGNISPPANIVAYDGTLKTQLTSEYLF